MEKQEEMANLFRDRGDQVVVVARQEFRLPGLKPITRPASMTSRTGAIAAAVVHPEPVVAIATLILMAAHLSRPADFDRDHDVDQADFGLFQVCLSGDGEPYEAGCADADLDPDGDVDQDDFGVFQACMGGAQNTPGC